MPSSAEADVKHYKLTLLKAAAENKVGPLRPFLQEGRLQWDDVRNKENQHILHVAALEGSEDVVTMLLNDPKVRRKVDSHDRASRSALHLASAMGFDAVVQRLVTANAQIDLQDETGCTPLHLAVKFEWVDTVRALLEAGADPLLEDSKGNNAMDTASKKQNQESAALMSAWAGRRRQLSTFEGLARCVFPSWRQHQQQGAREPSITDPHSQHDRGCGVGKMDISLAEGPEPQQLGARHSPANGSTPERKNLPQREGVDTDEVCLTLGADDNDGVIQREGSESGLGKKGDSRGVSGQNASNRSRSSGIGSGSARTTEETGTSEKNWWKRAVAEHNSRHRSSSCPPAGDVEASLGSQPSRQASAAAAAYAGTGAVATHGRGLMQNKPAEFAVIRLHMYFDEQVKRLEFEVEWSEVQPSAGKVKPSGEAERRGLICGDRIVEIGGTKTSGKGREELLPALKGRPLMIKVDRNAQVRNPQEPHVELDLPFNVSSFDKHGVEVICSGQLPLAANVQPQSKAWAAGMLEGDGIRRVNGRDVAKLSQSALLSALADNPQTVTVWRRPIGIDTSKPWTHQV
mmetsp:Transcript_73365/g.184991  ORF Transcript_73365/g.184991 Transcript_73365/m.184991 type:complete len:574 (-) Transcript_73365:213-1934(-)